MPRAMVRLSAGRQQMSEEAQLLCMMAGANSVFFGDKLLTTGNQEYAQDMALFEAAGIADLEPRLCNPVSAWLGCAVPGGPGRRGLSPTLSDAHNKSHSKRLGLFSAIV